MPESDRPDDDLAGLLRELQGRSPPDAAARLADEPPARIEAALAALGPASAARIAAQLPGAIEEAGEVAELPGVVSELMEPPRGALPQETTVADTIVWLRAQPEPQQLTYLYALDAAQRLVGLVVMRELLLAEPGQTLAQVMLREPFRLAPETPVGEAVAATVRRHYPVYPVCDEAGRLVGIVRGWKLFEHQALELSAQSGRMVGIDKEERVGTPFWAAFRARHPWLQINLLTAFLAAFVVGAFEDTITQIVALAAFLPLLAGQSGNTGCQALAISLRGLTLGDFDSLPLARLLTKEALLGALNGLLTGLVAGAAMWWTAGGLDGNPQALKLALVIVLAMTGACLVSGLFGVLVPLALRRCGADPATASSIFLTTGTDIAGMGLMLVLATALVL
ncbi:magnesium transporter [Stagnimonas aquatica]|uniref:Magnesium transporter n=1 Tax=Stagnimonas aquatica TaxID=2689987 RepID=A0A3N0VJW3_9GAMM|nr:magnesium transporter [Stagnimonas aquatica]ROH93053.1 magnesium transporter [Stagnimonas aquatica]